MHNFRLQNLKFKYLIDDCERPRQKASLKKEIQVPFKAYLFLGKWYGIATYFSLLKK